MTILLDSKVSQNASYANSISIAIESTDAPQLFAQQTLNLTNGTANQTFVEFEGIIGLEVPLLPIVTTVTIFVVRGTTPSDLIVFSAATNLGTSVTGPQVLSFSGSDSNPPNTSPVTYSAYVEVSELGVTRVGPESFNITGYSD